MNYLWDTNLLIYYVRSSSVYRDLDKRYDFFHENNQVFISIVTMGEIYSLAKRRNWGERKLERLAIIFSQLQLLPIAREGIVDAYADIDTFSQGKLTHKPLPQNMTARNMGKNDVWIAATAFHLNLILVTSDKDFDHLKGAFLELIRI